jgi:adenosine deaminase
MEDFIKAMPKVVRITEFQLNSLFGFIDDKISLLISLSQELHAHLNGSLSDKTLMKLIELRKKSHPEFETPAVINLSDFRSLSECFDVFKIAHDLVDSVDAVKLATECVIREFSDDNVVYLELRSTPRETERMSKLECLQAIVDTMM